MHNCAGFARHGRARCADLRQPPAARARLTRGERQAEQPGGALAQLSRRHRQEGLVHGVDVHVVDLVDAHDVAVAAQQGQHAQQRARQQRPVDELQDEAKGEGRTGAIGTQQGRRRAPCDCLNSTEADYPLTGKCAGEDRRRAAWHRRCKQTHSMRVLSPAAQLLNSRGRMNNNRASTI